jgi:hypothetical protein
MPGGIQAVTSILGQLEPRKRHDLQGAVRTVRFAIEALGAGERFEGDDGREQLAALEKAVETIEEILGLRPPASG